MPAKQRPRFNGDDEALGKALMMATPRDVQYVEDHKKPRNTKLLIKQRDRLNRLMDLQPSLSFKKSQLERVLLHIATTKQKDWNYNEELCKEFSEVVAARVHSMCRHMAQAMHGKKQPFWVQDVIGSRGGDTVGGDGASSTSVARDEVVECDTDEVVAKTTYFFGFSQELGQAWRCSHDDAGSKEYTKDIKVNPKGALSPALACWPDGTTSEIAELLSASVDERNRCSAPPASIPIDFQHNFDDGRRLTIKWRSEGPFRPPLMSMYLDGAQVCQVGIGDEVSKASATEILKVVAEQFVAGKVSLRELYSARDAEMKSRGLARRRMLKRPSAKQVQKAAEEEGDDDDDDDDDKSSEDKDEFSEDKQADQSQIEDCLGTESADHKSKPVGKKCARRILKKPPRSIDADQECDEAAHVVEHTPPPPPCVSFLEGYDMF